MAPKRKAAQKAEAKNKRIAINTTKAVEVLEAQDQEQEEEGEGEERERPSAPRRSSVQRDVPPSLPGKTSAPQSYGAPAQIQPSSQSSRPMPNLPIQGSDGATHTQKISLINRLQQMSKAGVTLPSGFGNATSSPSQPSQTMDSIDARSDPTRSQGRRRSQSNPVPNPIHQSGAPLEPPVSNTHGTPQGSVNQTQLQQGTQLQQTIELGQGNQDERCKKQSTDPTQLDFQNQAAIQRQLIAQQHQQLHPQRVMQPQQMVQPQQRFQRHQSEEPRYAPNQPSRPPANPAGVSKSSPLLPPFEPQASNPRSSFQPTRPRLNSATVQPSISPPNCARADAFTTGQHKITASPAKYSSSVVGKLGTSRQVNSSGLARLELPPNRPRTKAAVGGNSTGQSDVPTQQKSNSGQSQIPSKPIRRVKLVVSREDLRQRRHADVEVSPTTVKPGSRQLEQTQSRAKSNPYSRSDQPRNAASVQTQNGLAEGLPLPPVNLSNIDSRYLEPEEAQKRLEFDQTVHPAHLEALQKWSHQRALSPVDMEAEFRKMAVQARPENVDGFRNIGYDPLTKKLYHNPYLQFSLGVPSRKEDRIPLRHETVTQEEEARKSRPQQQQRPPRLREDSLPLAELYLNGLNERQGQMEQQDDQDRRRKVLTRTLSQFKIARAEDKRKNPKPPQVVRQSPQAFQYVALEMLSFAGISRPGAQMFENWNNPVRMEREDSDGCSFCQYECSFGISDSRVWVPEEAAQGFCLECHESTMTVARAWTDYDKLSPRMEKAELDRFEEIHEHSAVSPLKELGNNVNFYKQAADQLDNPLRLKTMDNFKARHKSQSRRATISGADRKSVMLGDRNLQRRAVSGGLGAAKATNNGAGDINRTSSQSVNGARGRPRMGNRHESMPLLGPSPLSGPPSCLRKSNEAQVTQTSWKGGVPMHNQPLMVGISSTRDQSGKLRTSNGSLTPNGEEIMNIMGFSPPPKITDNTALKLPDAKKPGPPKALLRSPISANSSLTSFVPSSANIAGNSNHAQPSRPTGLPIIPQRPLPARPLVGIDYPHSELLPPPSYNSDMNGIAPLRRPLHLQQPPFYKSPESGPDFCRGSPWRQVDFTRAKICPNCYQAKSLIIKHQQHSGFKLLVKVPGVTSREREGFGLVRSDGNQLVCDSRYSNCMICTGQAIHGCEACPLRVCEECEVRLRTMCKGKVENLLDFYGRTHIRNDAFLLRGDGKGF